MSTLANLYNDIKTLGLQMFQEKLVSGTNIKTINNQSLLGSGNISVGGSGGGLSFDDVYPVGSIYMSVNSTNPQTLFGGTWEQIEDKFLLASGTSYSNGATGGSADAVVVQHNHTQNAHTHTGTDGRGFVTHIDGQSISEKRVSVATSGSNYAPIITSSDNWYSVSQVGNATPTINNTGESGTGKNMPPYLVVNVWKRTA
jgi:hypothetical protein